MHLKSPAEIGKMRRSNQLVARVIQALCEQVKPGVTTLQLDRLAESMIYKADAKPAFKGYQGFPATVCASINEQVVHGIPNEKPLEEGDILSLDVGVQLDGYFGDRAITVPVGRINSEAQQLLETTEEALYIGIDQMQAGNLAGALVAARAVGTDVPGSQEPDPGQCHVLPGREPLDHHL